MRKGLRILIVWTVILLTWGSSVFGLTDWKYSDFNVPPGSIILQVDDWGKDTAYVFVDEDKDGEGVIRKYDATTAEYTIDRSITREDFYAYVREESAPLVTHPVRVLTPTGASPTFSDITLSEEEWKKYIDSVTSNSDKYYRIDNLDGLVEQVKYDGKLYNVGDQIPIGNYNYEVLENGDLKNMDTGKTISYEDASRSQTAGVTINPKQGAQEVLNQGSYDELITKYSAQNSLDTNLVKSMMKVESNYDKAAVSKEGAVGLMQLMPGTAYDMAKKLKDEGDPLFVNKDLNDFKNNQELLKDPEINIALGTRYLKYLKDELKLSGDNLLYAYNGGPKTVQTGNILTESKQFAANVNSLKTQIDIISDVNQKLLSALKTEEGSITAENGQVYNVFKKEGIWYYEGTTTPVTTLTVGTNRGVSSEKVATASKGAPTVSVIVASGGRVTEQMLSKLKDDLINNLKLTPEEAQKQIEAIKAGTATTTPGQPTDWNAKEKQYKEDAMKTYGNDLLASVYAKAAVNKEIQDFKTSLQTKYQFDEENPDYSKLSDADLAQLKGIYTWQGNKEKANEVNERIELRKIYNEYVKTMTAAKETPVGEDEFIERKKKGTELVNQFNKDNADVKLSLDEKTLEYKIDGVYTVLKSGTIKEIDPKTGKYVEKIVIFEIDLSKKEDTGKFIISLNQYSYLKEEGYTEELGKVTADNKAQLSDERVIEYNEYTRTFTITKNNIEIEKIQDLGSNTFVQYDPREESKTFEFYLNGNKVEIDGYKIDSKGTVTDRNGNLVAQFFGGNLEKGFPDKNKADDPSKYPSRIYHPDGTFTDYEYGTTADGKLTGGTGNGKGAIESTKYDKNYWPIEVCKGDTNCLYIDPVSGEIYQDKDRKIKCEEANCNKEALDLAKKRDIYSRIGPALQAAYTAAQGGTALSTLFGCRAGEKGLCSEWRAAMDEFFANNVIGQIISGRWEESFCHHYIERETPGVVLVDFPDTLTMVGVGAHIEAERSEPLVYPNETVEYLYKITYAVKNPTTTVPEEEQEIFFNVKLSGERTILLYDDYIEVEENDKKAKVGESAILQYSTYYYDEICLIFKEKIKTASGNFIDKVCNNIAEYTGEAIGYTPTETGEESAGTNTTGTSVEITI